MFATTLSFVVLAATSVSANVFITSPVASTVFTGGQKGTITWQDNGSVPSLKDFGPAKISIYAGNAQQQTLLQECSPSTDVGTVSTLDCQIDPKIGPNSNQYFVRFESLALKDAAAPQFPALAFSAKFTLAGMTGTFSPAVQAQIDGQATAPLAGATTASSVGATTPAASTPTPSLSTKPTGASSAKPSASKSATPSNAAVGTVASLNFGSFKMWIVSLAGVAVGVMLC